MTLEIDPRDRIGPRGSGGMVSLASILFVMFMVAIGAIAFFGTDLRAGLQRLGLASRPDFTAVYRKLGVAPLPLTAEADGTVTPELDRLSRDICLGQAITRLAEAVAKAGEIRWAADALTGWAASCGPDNLRQLRQATDMFLQLHDYARAETIAHGLVDAHPGQSDYWYLQGKAEFGLKQPEAALLSFANTIHLSADPAHVGSWVFTEMSDTYAAEHRYCEAMGPIQDYVSIDPAERATDKMRNLLALYAARGKCPAFASGAASLPVTSGNVIHAHVAINGVVGSFIVDTGASFVTVDATFAARAHLAATEAPRSRSETANGSVYTRLGTAATVKVGPAEARQVPVAILDKPMAGADGLLGRSFLSRFDVTIGDRRWTLKPRS